MLTFTLNDKEMSKIDNFIEMCNKEAVVRQRETMPSNDPAYGIAEEFWENGYPYHGASGGSVTYSFTPTSIGMICTVTYLENTEFQRSMDVTDYDEW